MVQFVKTDKLRTPIFVRCLTSCLDLVLIVECKICACLLISVSLHSRSRFCFSPTNAERAGGLLSIGSTFSNSLGLKVQRYNNTSSGRLFHRIFTGSLSVRNLHKHSLGIRSVGLRMHFSSIVITFRPFLFHWGTFLQRREHARGPAGHFAFRPSMSVPFQAIPLLSLIRDSLRVRTSLTPFRSSRRS